MWFFDCHHYTAFSQMMVYAALVKWAEEEDRSVSNLVVRIVAKALAEKESK